jgi:hypothetical protein
VIGAEGMKKKRRLTVSQFREINATTFEKSPVLSLPVPIPPPENVAIAAVNSSPRSSSARFS